VLPDVDLPKVELPTVTIPSQPQLALARALDEPPPPVTVVRGGASGELLAGPMLPVIPEDHIDDSVAPDLRNWLTPIERRQLAEASQRAAVAVTGTPLEWKAADNLGAETAAGVAMPLDDAKRSVRGRLCRDVWQQVKKAEEPHQQQVTLCRFDYGNGLSVWIVGDADQWP
jgi:surface antigen